MESDQDDDIELSNPVLNEYLNQFDEFSNLRHETEKFDTCEMKNKNKENEISLLNEKHSINDLNDCNARKLPSKLAFLIDEHKISKILFRDQTLTNQIILKEDIKHILDYYISGVDFNSNKFTFFIVVKLFSSILHTIRSYFYCKSILIYRCFI